LRYAAIQDKRAAAAQDNYMREDALGEADMDERKSLLPGNIDQYYGQNAFIPVAADVALVDYQLDPTCVGQAVMVYPDV